MYWGCHCIQLFDWWSLQRVELTNSLSWDSRLLSGLTRLCLEHYYFWLFNFAWITTNACIYGFCLIHSIPDDSEGHPPTLLSIFHAPALGYLRIGSDVNELTTFLRHITIPHSDILDLAYSTQIDFLQLASKNFGCQGRQELRREDRKKSRDTNFLEFLSATAIIPTRMSLTWAFGALFQIYINSDLHWFPRPVGQDFWKASSIETGVRAWICIMLTRRQVHITDFGCIVTTLGQDRRWCTIKKLAYTLLDTQDYDHHHLFFWPSLFSLGLLPNFHHFFVEKSETESETVYSLF